MKVIIILVVISVLASAAKYHRSQYRGYNSFFEKPVRRYTSSSRTFPGYLTRFIGIQPRHSRPGGQSNEPMFRTADQCVDAASIDMASFDPPTKIYKMKVKVMATFRGLYDNSNRTAALCVVERGHGSWFVTVRESCDPPGTDQFELSVEEADITEDSGCAIFKAKIAIGSVHPAEGCHLYRTPQGTGAQSPTYVGLACSPYSIGDWTSNQNLDFLYLTPMQTVDEQSPDSGVTTMYRLCAWETKNACGHDIGLISFTTLNPVQNPYHSRILEVTVTHVIRMDA